MFLSINNTDAFNKNLKIQWKNNAKFINHGREDHHPTKPYTYFTWLKI